MPKKLTQKEAKIQTSKTYSCGYHGKLAGIYKGNKIKCEFECPKCQTLFLRKPNTVWSNSSIFCTRCSEKLSGIRFMQYTQIGAEKLISTIEKRGYTGILVDTYQGTNTKYKFRCPICAKVFVRDFNHVRSQQAIFCIKCQQEYNTNQQKLTTQEIHENISNILVNGFNGIYLDGYINSKTKCIFECPICHKNFERRYTDVIQKKLIFCKKCGIELRTNKRKTSIITFKQKYNNIGAIPLEEYGYNNRSKIKWQCTQCKKTFLQSPNYVFSKNNTKCSKCNGKRPKITQQEAQNLIKEAGCKLIDKYKGYDNKHVFECKCGKKFKRSFHTVIDHRKRNLCLSCSRKYVKIVVEKLVPIIQKILNTNYKVENIIEQKIPGWQGGIDILINNIAIEYDGYYWHRVHNNAEKREKRKEKVIRNAGYKLLRIRSDGTDIPTEKQLRKVLLNHFEHGYNKWTITMKSWKEAKKRGENG
jgi:hypothetical protein